MSTFHYQRAKMLLYAAVVGLSANVKQGWLFLRNKPLSAMNPEDSMNQMHCSKNELMDDPWWRRLPCRQSEPGYDSLCTMMSSELNILHNFDFYSSAQDSPGMVLCQLLRVARVW